MTDLQRGKLCAPLYSGEHGGIALYPLLHTEVQTRYGEVAEITVVMHDYLGSQGQTRIPAKAGLTATQIN